MSLFDEEWLKATLVEVPVVVSAEPVEPLSYMRVRDEVLADVHDCLTHYFNAASVALDLREHIDYERFVKEVQDELYAALQRDHLDDPRRRCRSKRE